MTTAAHGQAACTALDQSELGGRRLKVNEAKPQERREGGFGGPRQRRESRW
jgi:RNA recognition motif-containing protein